MKLINNFILDAPVHLRPIFRISPFKTDDVELNNYFYSMPENVGKLKSYFHVQYPEMHVQLTPRGRDAIALALSAIKLNKNDVVTIFTTTNNFYISSCVTEEIEKFCCWSRSIEKNTKVIFINHEFGYCSRDVNYYKSLGYVVIEDYAHSFYSGTKKRNGFFSGDFLIYSLSKYFPVQAGGVLVYSNEYDFGEDVIEDDVSKYCEKVVSAYIDNADQIAIKRLNNYRYYEVLFTQLNIRPYFELNDDDYPGVFCFTVPEYVNLQEMKKYLNGQGIESSVFYGVSAYFLPCHQALSNKDIEYIFEVVKSYLSEFI